MPALALPSPAAAENYPSRPVTIVVPAAAGGGLDRVVRLLADKLRAKWDQPVVVENRGGAGGVIGTEFVAKAVGVQMSRTRAPLSRSNLTQQLRVDDPSLEMRPAAAAQ